MPINFCSRMAGRIRRLGYARTYAARFAGFFCISMLSVFGMTGTVLRDFVRGMAGEALSYILSIVLHAPSVVMDQLITGPGEYRSGARAGMYLPDRTGMRH
jgi:hypothetical protein